MAQIHWLDLVLAPLHWLEQARGWRRLPLLGFYGVILSVGGVLVSREAMIWRLPDAPEPFDLAKYGHIDLADSDNAMTFHDRAGQLLVADRGMYENEDRLFMGLFMRSQADQWDWRRAGSKDQAWLASNRAALDVWLAGTACSDALLVQPERLTASTPRTTVTRLRLLAHLGTLEATRRQASGDLAGAWTYYRGVIRSGLHAARHAGFDPAIAGSGILRLALPSVDGWGDEPGLSPELLRQAVEDLKACRGLRTTTSDLIRMEYFVTRAELEQMTANEFTRLGSDSPEWLNGWPPVSWVARFARDEPRSSLKVFRLITAGRLAQADRPYLDRPLLISSPYLIYDVDASTPPQLAQIAPGTLAGWADSSNCRIVLIRNNWNQFLQASALAGADRLDSSQLRLAERAYKLDHGGRPAQVYGELVPAYLDALPPTIEPGDPLAAP